LPWFRHKGTRRDNQEPHRHPSYPYEHPRGRWHKFPPTSRIRDRKGKHFRNTPEERRRVHVRGHYRERGGRRRAWD